MRIKVENYEIECFENEKDFKHWFKDNQLTEAPKYAGALYETTQEVRDLFNDNLLVSIKKKNYNDVQYIIIF